MSQQAIDALLELFADVMLESLGFLMDRIPAVPHRLHEIQLEQPVMPDDLERELFAAPSELDALIRLVRHEPQLSEATKHLAHRGRTDIQALRELPRADVPILRVGFVYRFNVVFDGWSAHYGINVG